MKKFIPRAFLHAHFLLALVFIASCSSSNRAVDSANAVDADFGTSTETLDPVDVRIPGSDISMRLIPMSGGEMTLGGEASADATMPGVSVRLSPFMIAQTETTFDAFAIFRFQDRDTDSTSVEGVMLPVDAVARPSTPYEDPSHGMDGAGYPAVGVTQWAAMQYARWLSKKTGLFFRLPTEAEWEYACLAGIRDAQTVKDPGDTSDSGPFSTSWYAENSDDRLHMVGRSTADAAGLFDMLGNVAEWTLDQYDESYYRDLLASGEPAVDPWREPSKLHPRTVRGGSFKSTISELSCKQREESSMRWKRRDPQIPKSFWWNTDSPFVGFRLVVPNNPPSEEEQAAFWSLVLGE